MEKYTRERLDGLSIHNLRELARDFGVQSPTSKRKEILISLILEIQDGVREKCYNVNKKGRPVKNGFASGSVIPSDFNEKELQDFNYDYDTQRFVGLINASNLDLEGSVGTVHSGIVDIHNNGFGILRTNTLLPNNNDCYIQSNLIYKYNLKQGDELECRTKVLRLGEPSRVVDILKINNVSVEKWGNITRFEDLPYNLSNETINLKLGADYGSNKLGVKIGGRNILVLNKTNNNLINLDCFKNAFNNSENIFVNFMSMPEEHANQNVINIPFNVKRDFAIIGLKLALDFAKRKVESGKSVVIILNRFNEYIKLLNDYYNGVVGSTNLNVNTLQDVKEMLLSAKFVNNNTNLTFVGVLNDDNSKLIQTIIEELKMFVNLIK